jgi:hypothetical protein
MGRLTTIGCVRSVCLLDQTPTMKKAGRNKSSSTCSTGASAPAVVGTDLDLFSCYSHEQVHIYDKLCSSVSSMCEVAYCTSEGITICVPQTCQRRATPSNSSQSTSCVSSMLVAHIVYPAAHAADGASPTAGSSSSSKLFFEQMKERLLVDLYKSFKHRPSSLSSFDRLLCPDTVQYKGFRSCLFSPVDIRLTRGQTVLATVTCAHELLVFEVVSSSRRFFLSQSSNLKFDLTKRLLECAPLERHLRDSHDPQHYRLLYFHLTSRILWNSTGTILFQLQYSGHLIVWTFDRREFFNAPDLSIVDTGISRPLAIVWNEASQMIMVIGKENRRVLIPVDSLTPFDVINENNDHMNTEHAHLMLAHDNVLLLFESKINYCCIHTIDLADRHVRVSSTRLPTAAAAAAARLGPHQPDLESARFSARRTRAVHSTIGFSRRLSLASMSSDSRRRAPTSNRF